MNESPPPVRRLIRLWDRDWNLCHVITPGDAVRADGDTYTLEYPADHLVSEWVRKASRNANLYMTVDPFPLGAGTRWIGMLREWLLAAPGACPHCPHCRQLVLRTVWQHEPETA